MVEILRTCKGTAKILHIITSVILLTWTIELNQDRLLEDYDLMCFLVLRKQLTRGLALTMNE